MNIRNLKNKHNLIYEFDLNTLLYCIALYKILFISKFILNTYFLNGYIPNSIDNSFIKNIEV